ncbi:penicillin-binding protein 2 [Ancylomarina euxinus]|uniref:Penicillin-binding protein 2 n=1 Tax=Ancylomarina euxinus TaxID=2283627 RepID=A0A425Y8G0_9BACT|nr:penicillin-binding protein 2 [Ancylomarina euxinus]MCZ4693334.1 penicillin-binding protein 2 [Ancylomarina euxinus]MUP13562.1 penicillin-binding protein 2 [Ancylomarina euxinus]RRG24790.1 penicillin-binding protein 2 [Ancylomarina euxinus]
MNNYSNRRFTIGGIFAFVILIFLIRLFNLQIVNDEYKLSAESNSQRRVTQYAARGLIYDRNGDLLVYNQAAYDLMIIPRQVKTFDTLDFCNLIGINKEDVIHRIKKAKKHSRYRSSIFIKQLSSECYAVLQEKLYKFPGFFVQTRTLRKYPHHNAAHTLGYLGEVNDRHIEKDKYYTQGDYIGKSGLESTYEEVLRGVKGLKVYWVDVYNRIKGSFHNGDLDKNAIEGQDITTTLDIKLQEYAEELMQNKKGSIVAIDPKTGEILVKLSSPSYDPEMFVGRAMSKNYRELANNDSLRPLFDRSMIATYPPGSIFKLINALIGLQEGIITPNTRIKCHDGYHAGRFTMGCHHHKSPLDLKESIQHSCNAYYAQTFREILDAPRFGSTSNGYTNWKKHVNSFGFGTKLGTDLPSELTGFIPQATYHAKRNKTKNWKSLNIVSMAIGQGELSITPLQMANMVSCIANRGYYYTPHIVKSIGSDGKIDSKFLIKNQTTIEPKYFEPVIEGMDLVVHGGEGSTGRSSAIKDIRVCGKTGTVQNPGIDHSVYVAFAPKDDPKIALVVYVENGVWGSRYAAPISGLIIEKYLKGEISENKKYLEKRMLEADLINTKEDKQDE